MSKKETAVDVHLKFVLTETGMFPALEGKCEISCVGADGKEWSGSITYNDGRNNEDAIKTICRMESFRNLLPQLAVVASSSSTEKALGGMEPEIPKSKEVSAPEDPYPEIRGQLLKKKIGELRKIISDQNLDLTTGGKKKEIVVDQIISRLKERDGITED